MTPCSVVPKNIRNLGNEWAQKRAQLWIEIIKLRKLVDAWHESQKIRTFLEAVQQTFKSRGQVIEQGSELSNWLTWVSEYADKIDALSRT